MSIIKTFVALLFISFLIPNAGAQVRRERTPDVYRLYGALTGKTVLRPSALPHLAASFSDSTADNPIDEKSNLLGRIEAELTAAKLDVIPDGEKFVWIVPAGLSNSPVLKELTRIPRPETRAATAESSGSVNPAGMINFMNTPVQEVLLVYSELRHRTLLQPASLPSPSISFYTQTTLTKDEVTYGINVVLVMNGLAIVDDGEKFAQIVPLRQSVEVRVGAPKSEVNAALMDPAKVPRLRERHFLPRIPGAAQQQNQVAALPPIADSLLAFYAELTGGKVIVSEPFGGRPVVFGIQTPLTKAELLYAIETTLRLNGLAIVSDEAGYVQLQALAAVTP